jgi:hypothetical protein
MRCSRAAHGAHGHPGRRQPPRRSSLVVHVDAAPASQSPARETLAWQLLTLLGRALRLAPERQVVPGGERLVLPLPRAS